MADMMKGAQSVKVEQKKIMTTSLKSEPKAICNPRVPEAKKLRHFNLAMSHIEIMEEGAISLGFVRTGFDGELSPNLSEFLRYIVENRLWEEGDHDLGV